MSILKEQTTNTYHNSISPFIRAWTFFISVRTRFNSVRIGFNGKRIKPVRTLMKKVQALMKSAVGNSIYCSLFSVLCNRMLIVSRESATTRISVEIAFFKDSILIDWFG